MSDILQRGAERLGHEIWEDKPGKGMSRHVEQVATEIIAADPGIWALVELAEWFGLQVWESQDVTNRARAALRKWEKGDE